MKNAPAVTARRAKKRIVRAPALLVLAAIVETTAPETQAAIVVAEQVVPVATTRLIDHAVMDRQLSGLAATAIGHTRRVPLAMAQPARRGLLAIAPIRRALRATVIRGRSVLVVTDHTPLVQRATEMRVHAVRATTALIRRVQRATETRVHAARATTALAFRVVTEIHVHLGPAAETVPTVRAPRAMAILLVGRRALVETAPIRRAPPETARAQTDLEAIVRIVRAQIVHTAISRVATGNPMGESAARSARR